MSHSHTLVKHEDTLTLFLDALYSASVLSPVRVLDRRQLRVEDLLVSKAAQLSKPLHRILDPTRKREGTGPLSASPKG